MVFSTGELACLTISAADGGISSRHRVQQYESILRGGLLVLTRHQLTVDDDEGVVGSHAKVVRAGLFQDSLGKVGDQETAAKDTLELLIPFQRVPRHIAPADSLGIVPERDRAVTNCSHDL